MNNPASFSAGFVKVISEEQGITNLSESCTSFVTDDVTFKCALALYQATKLMHCCKRRRLLHSDIDNALKLYNIQPTYGVQAKEWIPFRRSGTSNAGRDVLTLEERELDLEDYINTELPKPSPPVTLKAHWLCINGVQPLIPENPASDGKHSAVASIAFGGALLSGIVPPAAIELAKDKASGDLTIEQQVYFKEVSEACVCADEARRKEALASLSFDPGLQPLVPRLVSFISEGVKINVARQFYVTLIYLIRMLRSLIDNPNLNLDAYAHCLLPACFNCCVSKQLSASRDDNHWALRVFSSRQLAFVVRKYSTEANAMHARVVRQAVRILQDNSYSLYKVYGAIAILGDLGEEVIRSTLIPFLRHLGDRVRAVDDQGTDDGAIRKISDILQQTVCPLLVRMIQAPDQLADYSNRFGYFGHVLYTGTMTERKKQQDQAQKKQQLQHTPAASPAPTGRMGPSTPMAAMPNAAFAFPTPAVAGVTRTTGSQQQQQPQFTMRVMPRQ